MYSNSIFMLLLLFIFININRRQPCSLDIIMISRFICDRNWSNVSQTEEFCFVSRMPLQCHSFHTASWQFARSVLQNYSCLYIFVISLGREAISLVCEAVPGAKGAQRKRKVQSENVCNYLKENNTCFWT